jgi:hypothetical protein
MAPATIPSEAMRLMMLIALFLLALRKYRLAMYKAKLKLEFSSAFQQFAMFYRVFFV